MVIEFPPIVVSAPQSAIYRAAIAALAPVRRGKYMYWQDDEDGRIYLLNRRAFLVAGAAHLAGLRPEQWMPEWRRQFKLKEVVRA